MDLILIADDSGTARMFVRRCLEIAGCSDASFLEASNGNEAMVLMKEHRPDLIVTDLTMPLMDGMELLRQISADSRLKAVPVLVVTSSANSAREQELLAMGAYAVISKPVSPAAIAKIIEPLLDREGKE